MARRGCGPEWRAEVAARVNLARRGRRALRNCAAIHLLAPYGVGAVNDTRTILGWQPIPSLLQWQPGGRGKASLTFARAARPEGNGVDWQEGENRRCSPSCPQCGRAGHIYVRNEQAHTAHCDIVSPGARCAPLRVTGHLSSTHKKGSGTNVPKPFSFMPYAGRNHAGTVFSSRSRSRNTAAAARSYSSAVRDFLSALPCFSLSANRFK